MAGCSPKPITPHAADAGSPEAVKQARPPGLAVPAENIRFEDSTVAAGLDFVQSNGACGMRYFVEQVASGASFLDANGDGNLDIVFPQPKPLGECVAKLKGPFNQRLYLGDGEGHFKLAPDAFKGAQTDYGISAAIGDYDNDGRPDIYMACFGKNKLFHNNGDGTFADVTAKAGVEVGGMSTGAVWFDYDGDGKLDLYVLRYCDWNLKNDVVCLGPNGERDNCHPRTYTPATNKLFHNLGNDRFEDVTAKANAAPEKRRSLGVAAVDFDGDGKIDLFVANDLGPNYLLHNNGDGTFTDEAMQQGVAFGKNGKEQANMGVAVGDYDHSGRPSVLVTTFSGEPYTLYRNDGDYFTDVSDETGIAAATLPYLAFGTFFIDSRNTGQLDLFFAQGHVTPFAKKQGGAMGFKERNMLVVQGDNGLYAEVANAIPRNEMQVHRGALYGDVDNDGRLDILTTASDGRPTLLHNDTKGTGNWLALDLRAANGCCTPVGARCEATVGGRKLVSWLVGGGSYAGDSDMRIHFGLGKDTKVDSLNIRWPSGTTQELKDVKANQVLKVMENRG